MIQTNPYSRLSVPRRRLFGGFMTTSAQVIYRCPEGKTCEIVSIVLANVHSGSENVTIYHCLPNESPADSNALYYQNSLSSKTTTVDDTRKFLTSGESIQALASAASRIVLHIYGIES
jgi:hypothetical protein